MEARGHGDDGDIDSRADQGVDVGKDRQFTGNAVWIAACVGDGHEFHALNLAQYARVVPAHHADTEQTCTKRHQAPAFATCATAVTIRSRSAWVREGCTGRETTSRAAISVSGRSRPGAYDSSDGSR